MTAAPSLEDAIKTIAAGYRRERVRGTVRAALYFVGILSFYSLLFFFLTIDSEPISFAGRALIFVCLLAFLIFPFFSLRESLIRLKGEEQEKMRLFRDCPEGWYCAKLLLENGFDELALNTYDKLLENLFVEAEKREGKLNRFFEEFHTKARFVDGFPRPVPDFGDHDLSLFQDYISKRAECLTKLGREKEAEEANAQLEVIATIRSEGEELTEKYWKGLYDY